MRIVKFAIVPDETLIIGKPDHKKYLEAAMDVFLIGSPRLYSAAARVFYNNVALDLRLYRAAGMRFLTTNANQRYSPRFFTETLRIHFNIIEHLDDWATTITTALNQMHKEYGLRKLVQVVWIATCPPSHAPCRALDEHEASNHALPLGYPNLSTHALLVTALRFLNRRMGMIIAREGYVASEEFQGFFSMPADDGIDPCDVRYFRAAGAHLIACQECFRQDKASSRRFHEVVEAGSAEPDTALPLVRLDRKEFGVYWLGATVRRQMVARETALEAPAAEPEEELARTAPDHNNDGSSPIAYLSDDSSSDDSSSDVSSSDPDPDPDSDDPGPSREREPWSVEAIPLNLRAAIDILSPDLSAGDESDQPEYDNTGRRVESRKALASSPPAPRSSSGDDGSYDDVLPFVLPGVAAMNELPRSQGLPCSDDTSSSEEDESSSSDDTDSSDEDMPESESQEIAKLRGILAALDQVVAVLPSRNDVPPMIRSISSVGDTLPSVEGGDGGGASVHDDVVFNFEEEEDDVLDEDIISSEDEVDSDSGENSEDVQELPVLAAVAEQQQASPRPREGAAKKPLVAHGKQRSCLDQVTFSDNGSTASSSEEENIPSRTNIPSLKKRKRASSEVSVSNYDDDDDRSEVPRIPETEAPLQREASVDLSISPTRPVALDTPIRVGRSSSKSSSLEKESNPTTPSPKRQKTSTQQVALDEVHTPPQLVGVPAAEEGRRQRRGRKNQRRRHRRYPRKKQGRGQMRGPPVAPLGPRSLIGSGRVGL